jgi:hypothetical protein
MAVSRLKSTQKNNFNNTIGKKEMLEQGTLNTGLALQYEETFQPILFFCHFVSPSVNISI